MTHSEKVRKKQTVVKISKTYKFISNRDIKEGEELFENYNLSTKEWL